MQPIMASPADPVPADVSRRAFLKTVAAVAASAPLSGVLRAQPAGAGAPLMAYVGTFSSPLRDVLPTQVDLPPGNGRGIHLFRVGSHHRGHDAARGVTKWGPARVAWR